MIQGLARHRRDDSALMAECEKRLAKFEATREGIPFDEVADWMDSWFTDDEKPKPQCRVL